jgi:dihydroflavonol-4-reductase
VPGAAFLTGGSGVVGRAVLERLCAAGRDVVALARTPASAAALEALGARTTRGDVLDPGSLERAMHGCTVVYHVAGLNTLCLPNPAPLYNVNVTGTLNVVRAAARAGVGRVVYTSSASTLGEGPGTVGDERTPHRGWYLSHYEHSKHEAERTALSAGAAASIDVVSVNPSSVQGPGRSGGTAKILRSYLEGKLRFFFETSVSIVDVRDCAEGHVLAEARGAPGERYVLNGATLSTQRALQIVAAAAGIEERPVLLPRAAVMGAATAVGAVGHVLRRPVPLCREMARTLLHGHAYDGSRAARDLGVVYRPPEETLADAVAWLVASGFVSRPGAGTVRSAPGPR